MGAWLMAGAGLAQGLGSFFGSRALKSGIKTAGTQLYQSRQREAQNALQMPETVNPAISEAYRTAGQDLSTVANRSADDIGAAGRAANEYLNPYIEGGGKAFTSLGELAQEPQAKFDFQFSQDDPSYQFRLQEGQKALERSAAARGILQTGGTAKALARYGQDAASQEYQSAFNRALGTFGANQSARQNRISTLAGMANVGYGASGAAGQNLIGTTQTGANWRNMAAQTQGQWGIDSQNRQTDIAMKYGDLARQLRMAGDEATVQSILGNAQATGDMWAGLGKSIGSTLGSYGQSQGGWGGGWGFGNSGNDVMPVGWESGIPIKKG